MTQDKDQTTPTTSVEKKSESSIEKAVADSTTTNEQDRDIKADADVNLTERDEKSAEAKADEALAKLAQELEATKASDNEQAPDTKKASNEVLKDTKSTPRKNVNDAKDGAKIKPVKSGRGLAIFAFLLALIAIGGSGFLYWQAQLWLQNQQQVDNLKQQSFDASQQTINQLQSQLTQLQAQLSSAQRNQANYVQALADVQARTQELGETQPNQWLAAEALYLANLAERRLLIEKDITTAQQLLVAANVRLTAMNDANVFSLREAISKDIAALRAVTQPETEAVYLAISGVIDQLDKLEFKYTFTPVAEVVTTTPEVSANSEDWLDNLKISLKRFMSNFFDVQHIDAKTGPQLPADQQWYVRSHVRTQLLQAQQAVLNGQQALYLDAVSKSQKWILEYFNNDSNLLIATDVTLSELLTKDVGLTLPAELQSQAVIAEYVRNELNLNAQTGGQHD